MASCSRVFQKPKYAQEKRNSIKNAIYMIYSGTVKSDRVLLV